MSTQIAISARQAIITMKNEGLSDSQIYAFIDNAKPVTTYEGTTYHYPKNVYKHISKVRS